MEEVRVLSTLNPDGSRRWIRPRLSKGRWYGPRLVLAWVLVALFAAIPYLRMNGKPLILLDVPRREFTLFGTTFLPTDTMLLMLLLVGIFVAIFLLTAIFGRVWCGWACPQTVYMEFLYRPIERLVEGKRSDQMRMDREGPHPRRFLKYALFLLVSMFLAHTFLAYFVGVESLARWITGSPFQHPAAFLVMAATTALMYLDFGWFREQTCLVACPYGRFQSVLLDRRSLIVGYDAGRGEPRGKPSDRTGDCIDCRACVITCPTGIDIRDGLQMECIACTQCIDACDEVMERIGKPRGLVRYSSQDELAGQPRRLLRPRVVIYPVILLLVFGALGIALARRSSADVTVLRGIGAPYALIPGGDVSNQLRVKIVNRAPGERTYAVHLVEGDDLHVISPDLPLTLGPGKTGTASVFITADPEVFTEGRRDIRLAVSDGVDFSEEVPYRLLGPEKAE